MHTGFTGTTRTFFGIPYTVYQQSTPPPPTLNTSITFDNKTATTPKHIAKCFIKQFTSAAHKTNICINRATHKIQGYNITLTTTHFQAAIQQSQNDNSQDPDKLKTSGTSNT